MDRSIDRPIDRSIHRSIDRSIDRPHRISHRIGDRISPIGDRIASDRTSGIFSRVFLCFFACLRARAVVSCLIHSRASRVDPRSRRRRLRRRQRDLSSSCYIGTYVFCAWRSRRASRVAARAFAFARMPFARVTRRANVILNDASAARASAGCARACARVMVWGVVVRDRARTGVGARSRARIVRAHRGRSVPSRMMMPTRREISRVANVRVARRVRWGIARAHGREGVEDICLHACASRTCVIARRGGRGRGECVIENSCAPQGDEVARGVHVTPCGSARMAYISR